MRSTQNSILDEIPKELDVVDFAASRAAELEAMAKAAAHVNANKAVNQGLPRHMRRRAASHNAKRLPCRAREAALKEWQKNPPGTTKRPSRRHRRRPSNLLHEYSRRKRLHVWLETHIWHAKRFHMKELFGYKLANFPNNKSVRALHRACNKYSTLYDVSYYGCVEITGTETDIVDGLSHLTNSDCSAHFTAKMYLYGHHEGSAVLYKMDMYPQGAMGLVQFMWKPSNAFFNSEDNSTVMRCLWLWVHPAMYTELLDQLQAVYNLLPIENQQEMEKRPVAKKRKISQKDKLMAHDALMCTNPVFKSDKLTVTSLKDTMCRYRLNGPLSQSILSSLLIPADVHTDEGSLDTDSNMWWENFYSSSFSKQIHCMQQDLWQTLQQAQSPGELPAQVILALTVRDPRLFLPTKRTVVDAGQHDTNNPSAPIEDWPVEAGVGPIWEKGMRDEVKMSRMADHELNKLRSQHLLPGTVLKLGQKENRIPVMLIQHPGSQRSLSSDGAGRRPQSGYGSGWDLVVPAGWGMAFWLGLVYRGARVGGLRDLDSCNAEQRVLSFPQDFPDTVAGQSEANAVEQHLWGKYERMPPAKRPNYVKLGVVSPFKCPWADLVTSQVHQTIQNVDKLEEAKMLSVTVLRASKETQRLSKYCNTKCDLGAGDQCLSILGNAFQVYGSFLVPVSLECMQKGTPVGFSSISIPTPADVDLLSKQPNYGGPMEPLHKDPEGVLRKKKRKQKKTIGKDIDVNDLGQVSNMDVKCTRNIIGYVKHGNYSLAAARGCGLGFVILAGLTKLLQERKDGQRTIVLVRSPNSLQYRFAYLSVIC